MSSYLYGMHDQITKGYAPLKVSPRGGPFDMDSQGLVPEGLGSEGASSMSEDAFPGSSPSWVMDTQALGNSQEGTGSSGYGGKLKESEGGLGDPRRVVEASIQAFAGAATDRIHTLRALPRLTRHPLHAHVRQLDTASERYIAAPQYTDPTTRVTGEELKARVFDRSDTVTEIPEPNQGQSPTIGVLLNAQISQAQINAVKAANRIALDNANVLSAAAKIAANQQGGRNVTLKGAPGPSDLQIWWATHKGTVFGGALAIAAVAALLYFTGRKGKR